MDGPRWSVEAEWGTDDWQDKTTWDAAHVYSPSAALSFGVYVAGLDVTDELRSAGWSLGRMELLASTVGPSTASLDLAPSASAAPGDRVVILSTWDVYWVGVVASCQEVETVERTTLSCSCVDDLARGGMAELDSRRIGGDALGSARTLLRIAGMVGQVYADDPDDPPESASDLYRGMQDTVKLKTVDSPVLSTLSGIGWACAWQLAWTPAGLRLGPFTLSHELDYGTPVTDLDDFHTITRYEDVDTVRTLWRVSGWDPTTWGYTKREYRDLDAADTYGWRVVIADLSDWNADDATAVDPWAFAAEGDDTDASETFGDYYSPVQTVSLEGKARDGRHAITRPLPLDYVSDGDPTLSGTTTRYRILAVSHTVTPDEWTVALDGVAVELPEAY